MRHEVATTYFDFAVGSYNSAVSNRFSYPIAGLGSTTYAFPNGTRFEPDASFRHKLCPGVLENKLPTIVIEVAYGQGIRNLHEKACAYIGNIGSPVRVVKGLKLYEPTFDEMDTNEIQFENESDAVSSRRCRRMCALIYTRSRTDYPNIVNVDQFAQGSNCCKPTIVSFGEDELSVLIQRNISAMTGTDDPIIRNECYDIVIPRDIVYEGVPLTNLPDNYNTNVNLDIHFRLNEIRSILVRKGWCA